MPFSDIPPKLYKYLAPVRLDFLDSGLLRYSPLGAFNDPFEGRPEIRGLTSPAAAKAIFENSMPSALLDIYQGLPMEIREGIRLEEFSEAMLPMLHENMPAMVENFLGHANLIPGVLTSKLDEQIGALCFSEVPDSLLMWSHYGCSHEGYVVSIDTSHPYFHQQRSDDDELRHLRRVSYRETRPSKNLSDMDGVDIFLVKSGHWSYEREWRMMHALSEADRKVLATPFPICLFKIPLEAVVDVIIGARMKPEHEDRLRLALAKPEAKHIKILRATPDSKHFHLQIDDA